MTLFEQGNFEAMRVKETTDLFADFGFKGANLDSFSSFTDFAEELSPAKRKLVYAAVELYKRMTDAKRNQEQIRSAADIYQTMKPLLFDLLNEESWVIYMNQSCRVIAKKRLSVGGFTETAVDIRLMLKHAFLMNATVIALVHNHPSGSKNPSNEDRKLTERVRQAAKLVNIHFLDHVIVAGNDYYSFADDGLI